MEKLSKKLQANIVEKGLTVGTYKGVHHAKRIMMKAGLPVDEVTKVLSQEQNNKATVDKSY